MLRGTSSTALDIVVVAIFLNAGWMRASHGKLTLVCWRRPKQLGPDVGVRNPTAARLVDQPPPLKLRPDRYHGAHKIPNSLGVGWDQMFD